jgi:hypothetical protein
MSDNAQLLRSVLEVPAVGFTAVYEKQTLVAHRRSKDGHEQIVEIDILDAGRESDLPLRYQVFARSDDGRSAAGNPAAERQDRPTHSALVRSRPRLVGACHCFTRVMPGTRGIQWAWRQTSRSTRETYSSTPKSSFGPLGSSTAPS